MVCFKSCARDGGWGGGFEGEKVEDLKLFYLLLWLASVSGKVIWMISREYLLALED